MSTPEDVREQIVGALGGRAAYPEAASALEGVPESARGKRVPGIAHTLWQLLEHLRLAQWDILEYGRNPAHQSPEFPVGYWPSSDSPPGDAAWNESLRGFFSDLDALRMIAADRELDLTAPIPHLDGVTWLRELMLVVSHNAYHIGQFVQLRRALGCWNG